MSEMIVYHGDTEPISTPICKFGRPNLDFGQGFYITNTREQAIAWATTWHATDSRRAYSTATR